MDMKKACFSTFVLLTFLSLLIAPVELSAGDDTPENQYDHLYDALMSLEADPDQIYAVKNFEFSRDVGKFTLQEGLIYFCKPSLN